MFSDSQKYNKKHKKVVYLSNDSGKAAIEENTANEMKFNFTSKKVSMFSDISTAAKKILLLSDDGTQNEITDLAIPAV